MLRILLRFMLLLPGLFGHGGTGIGGLDALMMPNVFLQHIVLSFLLVKHLKLPPILHIGKWNSVGMTLLLEQKPSIAFMHGVIIRQTLGMVHAQKVMPEGCALMD